MKYWTSLFIAGLTCAAVIRKDDQHYNSLGDCPGYRASNVQTSETGLTAALTLAGEPCNVYGYDLTDLILEVTYETGK